MIFDNVRIIGFDLDQTLYPKSSAIDDAIQHYLYEKIAERLLIDLAEAECRFRSLYLEGRGISGSKTLFALGFSQEEASTAVQEALERADIDAYLVPHPETLAFLQRCAERFDAVDLITGSARDIAKRKLENLRIPITLFGMCITGDDASKSDGAAYRAWLAHYPERSASEFLYVGDRPSSDYEAPRLLGIRSVLVNVADAQADCPQYASIAELDRALFGH